jgi:hypothetical protein
MATEWLRVMMDEVERKRREAIAARVESERRQVASTTPPTAGRFATRTG